MFPSGSHTLRAVKPGPGHAGPYTMLGLMAQRWLAASGLRLADRSVLVVGLGRSGIAAARLCLNKGARVTLNDAASRDRLSKDALALEAEGARIIAGGHPDNLFDGIDLCVISPGVPSFPALEAFERSGREVIGEMELAARFVSAPIALIGGTNGKSTTTALSTYTALLAGLVKLTLGAVLVSLTVKVLAALVVWAPRLSVARAVSVWVPAGGLLQTRLQGVAVRVPITWPLARNTA